MAGKSKKLEAIVPQLAPGRVTVVANSMKYVRADGQQLNLPSECLPAFNGFLAGKSVRKFVVETYQKGLPVDFVALKHTLYSLYWSHNLLNEQEFRRAIETVDWMPVSDSHLLNPIIETNISGEGAGTQLLIFAVVIALVILEAKLFLQPDKILYALLFFPTAFLNIKGVLSAAVSAIYNQAPQTLNLHVSLLGAYVRESSEKRRHITNYEYFFHLLLTLGMGGIAIAYFNASEDITVSRIGVALTFLLVSILHSPAHRTDLSNLYLSVKKGESAKTSAVYVLGVMAFVFTSCAYLFSTVLTAFFVVPNYEDLNIYPYVALVALTGAFFFDLLDNFDFIFDQIAGRFIAPMQSSFSRIFKKKPRVDLVAFIFRKIPIFQGLPDAILNEMTWSSKIVQVRQGVTICKTGQTTTDLYVIVKGRVGIYNNKPDGTLFKVLELEDGSIFGEGSFFLNRPRRGDAVTLAPTTVLCIKRPKAFDQAAKDNQKVDTGFQRKIWSFQSMANSKMFKDTPSELVMQMVSKGTIVELPENRIIMNRGDVPDSLWVTIQGKCRATNETGHGGNIEPGEVFGEIGIIWNSRRTSTVTTLTSVVLLRIDARDIWGILGNCIDLGVSLQELGQKRLMSDAA